MGAVDTTVMSGSNRPLIAVCLAAYNGRAYLQDQMDSILGQAGVNVLVFVSVDRSSDGTEDWFLQLQNNPSC